MLQSYRTYIFLYFWNFKLTYAEFRLQNIGKYGPGPNGEKYQKSTKLLFRKNHMIQEIQYAYEEIKILE